MKFDFGSLGREFEADWPVRVSVSEDGGKVRIQEFMIRFRLAPEVELSEFAVPDGLEGAMANLPEALAQVTKALDRVIVGFGKGEAETWSAEMLDRMVARPAVRVALVKAYGQFAMGSSPKNS